MLCAVRSVLAVCVACTLRAWGRLADASDQWTTVVLMVVLTIALMADLLVVLTDVLMTKFGWWVLRLDRMRWRDQ